MGFLDTCLSNNNLFLIYDTGQGTWSSTFRFRTTKSPPVIAKSPVVVDVGTSACRVEWNAAKIVTTADSSDVGSSEDEGEREGQLEYCLQLQQAKKDSDYRDVYKGSETSFHCKDLEPGSDYNIRVCAIRLHNSSSSKRICSAFTPHTQFTTLKLNTKSNLLKPSMFIFIKLDRGVVVKFMILFFKHCSLSKYKNQHKFTYFFKFEVIEDKVIEINI